ncbi:MAG: hypothetical protein KJ690_02925 [Alphaproteobacteria bacterium]|nr:hypothetical protein [Alphaproteobacteria bacterium]
MRARKSEEPFADRVARVWGGLNEMVQTADDPDVAMAAFFRVMPGQLRAWRAAEGRHPCGGTTSRGHGCRNQASALIDYDPRVWAARDPVFCPSHMPADKEPAPARPDHPSVASQVTGGDAATEDDERPPAR